VREPGLREGLPSRGGDPAGVDGPTQSRIAFDVGLQQGLGCERSQRVEHRDDRSLGITGGCGHEAVIERPLQSATPSRRTGGEQSTQRRGQLVTQQRIEPWRAHTRPREPLRTHVAGELDRIDIGPLRDVLEIVGGERRGCCAVEDRRQRGGYLHELARDLQEILAHDDVDHCVLGGREQHRRAGDLAAAIADHDPHALTGVGRR